ncbi:zinc ABC transporter substrate-binding protein [Vibrio sp. 10N.286.49.B3]|uniref:zinc ABC transporter substrate-binding protein ZnuA n=1 Tax=Vibrio sp. 10N.286.49.B3 TaxID=1880855 RepID=UPI000C82E6D0|nr:zinc ABC transporter substrate-binding protein ZnuA [Vibrio sp. 10N.286.49.B3]PMH41903.1 zinc ABC transporter substrate-binding protein [Vibrio sp. 10N.286.49.B3]
MSLRYVSTLLSLLLVSLPSSATVLTSIKPIQMITHELTLGVETPNVLLGSNTSPHDYALKPSDVKQINEAELVIWFGQDLEPFLSKILSNRTNVLTLSDDSRLMLREFADAHAHEGHDHGTRDPHFWLATEQASQAAHIISGKLMQLDPDNKATYEANLQQFITGLATTKEEIAQQLAPVTDKGYYVFHDAYDYFEKEFGLNNLGYFTVNPDRKPGAKTLIKIRTELRSNSVACVFSEPQFTPAVIESVVRGSQVNIGQLDPIGIEIEVGKDSYFHFLKALSNSYYQCLSQ